MMSSPFRSLGVVPVALAAALLLILSTMGLSSLGPTSLGGAAAAQADEPAASGDGGSETYRVVSFNIRFNNPRDGEDAWPKRRDRVAELLQELAPDLIGLQEVLPSQRDDLRERLPGYEIYSVGRDDGADRGEASTILWKRERFEQQGVETFWLSPTPEQVGSKGWDAALPRIVSHVTLRDRSSGRVVHLFNTHFDHQSETARRESGSLLRRRILESVGNDAWVAIGDLNARPDSVPLRRLRGLNDDGSVDPDAVDSVWLDAYESAAKRTGPDSTWNGFREIEPGQRIDHLIVAPTTTVESFDVLDRRYDGRFPSDHLPIVGTLRFGASD